MERWSCVPPPSPALPGHSNTKSREPCPSRHCAMLPVDERLMNKSNDFPVSVSPALACPAPTQELAWRKKALSLNGAPLPSPLHQISSAGEAAFQTSPFILLYYFIRQTWKVKYNVESQL